MISEVSAVSIDANKEVWLEVMLAGKSEEIKAGEKHDICGLKTSKVLFAFGTARETANIKVSAVVGAFDLGFNFC